MSVVSQRHAETVSEAGHGFGLPTLTVAVIAAIALRLVSPLTTDVSWLITAGEKVLDGGRLYRDVIETNPPLSVLSYVPAIALARMFHIAPEPVVVVLVLLAIAGVLGCARRMLGGTETLRVGGWPLSVAAVGILAILPMDVFAQREHLALIALVPFLAACIRRVEGLGVSVAGAIIAGLGAAVTMAFKPLFALPVLICAIVVAMRLKSWRALAAPEMMIAGCGTVAAIAATVWLWPQYLTVIGPLVRDVYLRAALPLATLLTGQAVLIWIAVVLAAILAGRRAGSPSSSVLLAASAGFAIAFLIQRRGWPYHSYPMIALALMALCVVVVQSGAQRGRSWPAAFVLALGFVASAAWFNGASAVPGLRDAVAGIAPPHPRLLVLSAEPSLGHPLVRDLSGRWVSRQQALWVTGYLHWLRRHGRLAAGDHSLDAHAAQERAWLIADIKRSPPDIVIVDDALDDWSGWLRADSQLQALLAGCRQVTSIHRLDILRCDRD